VDALVGIAFITGTDIIRSRFRARRGSVARANGGAQRPRRARYPGAWELKVTPIVGPAAFPTSKNRDPSNGRYGPYGVSEMDRRGIGLRGCLSCCSRVSPTGLGQKPAKGAVKVEDLQKNWRTLLADGAERGQRHGAAQMSDAEWKSSFRARRTTCYGTRAPSARVRARSTARSARSVSCARAAACRFSPRR